MKILVVGGGIVGLTIVREFQKRGVSEILLFDSEDLGREASYAAAGMLAPQAESNIDDAFFQLCSTARDFYPDFISELEDETGIEVELDRSGTLCAAFDQSDKDGLDLRFSWQTQSGYEVESLNGSETRKIEPFISPKVVGSLYFPNDWQVENRKLLSALINTVNRVNPTIYKRESVRSISFESDHTAGLVTQKGGVYKGDVIILATGAWTSLIETDHATFRLPSVKPVRGQMISYQLSGHPIERVIYGTNGYVVPRRDGRLLAGATTEDVGFQNKTSDTGIEELQKNANKLIPELTKLAPNEKWSGLRPYAKNGMPLIGKIPDCDNMLISTGHYRNGILLAPFTARILVESILGLAHSDFLDDFEPGGRVSAASS